jgi:hypothetical protein
MRFVYQCVVQRSASGFESGSPQVSATSHRNGEYIEETDFWPHCSDRECTNRRFNLLNIGTVVCMWYTDIGRPSGCTYLSAGCPAANQDVPGNVPGEIPRHVTSDAFYESTSMSRSYTECAYGLLAHEIETAALSYHPRTASIGVADYMYLPTMGSHGASKRSRCSVTALWQMLQARNNKPLMLQL